MKKIKIGIVFWAVLMMLAACGQEDEPEAPITPESSSSSVTNPSMPESPEGLPSTSPEIVIEDDTLPPREGMVRSPLTNEWVDPDVAETRPIAVIIPNEIKN